jgi:hypothetical protein
MDAKAEPVNLCDAVAQASAPAGFRKGGQDCGVSRPGCEFERRLAARRHTWRDALGIHVLMEQLTNHRWLNPPAMHAAVLAAYGFSAKKDLLAQLLALTLEVAAKIEQGIAVTAPGVPPSYPDPKKLVTEDCIKPV